MPSDFSVVVLVLSAAFLGWLAGRNTGHVEYVYVEDDGTGGVSFIGEPPPFDCDPGGSEIDELEALWERV